MAKFRSDLNEWLTKAVIVAMVLVSLVTPAQAAGSRPDDTLAPDPGGTSTLAFSVSQLAAAPTQEQPERHGTDTAASPRSLSLIDLDTVRPIVVATEEGVYYTTNLDASSPTWQSLNTGFTTDEDRFVESVWFELYAYPDWWTGSIWAGTRSGIWLLSNAFGEGAWEQRMSREEFWALVTAQTGYVFAEDSFRVVAIEGSLDNYGTVYAVVRGRKDGSNPANDNCVWLVRSTDRFVTWTATLVVGPTVMFYGSPSLAVAQHSLGETLYVGYQYTGGWRRIVKSLDGGLSFAPVYTQASGYGKNIDDMDIPFVSRSWDDSRIYAAGGNGSTTYTDTVLTSGNGGQDWSALGFPTPADQRFQISSDTHDPDKLAFMTAYSVTVSTNGGQTWSPFGGGTTTPDRLNSFSVRRDAQGDIADVLMGTKQTSDNGDAKVYLNEGGALINKTGNLTTSGTLDEIWFVSQVPPLAPVRPDGTWTCNACPYANCSGFCNTPADPINTLTGNFSHQHTDLSIPTPGEPLYFERSYNAHSTGVYSASIVYDEALGPGWTYNYAASLVFSGTVGGDPGMVIFREPKGSRLAFFDYGEGHYVAYPGVYATLDRAGSSAPYTYTVTAFNQERHVFDDDGRLLYHYDAKGNATAFSYDGSNRLSRVADASSNRYLEFQYDANDHLVRVADHTGRDVEYGYNASGELAVVTDTMGLARTLVYTSTGTYDHLLEEVIDQNGQRVMKNQYDSQGRVVRQWNALDELTEIEYDPASTVQVPGGTMTVTNDLDVQSIDVYSSRGVLVSREDAAGEVRETTYDGFFNRSAIQDENGRVTQVRSNENGQPESVQDAQGNRTEIAYDEWNNVTSYTSALTQTTSYDYEVVTRTVNGLAFTMTNLITATDPLSHTTVYAYNERGQVTSTTDAMGNTTRYGYDDLGQRVVVTDALSAITRYGYDALGRLITATVAAGTALERVAVNEYDDGDRLIRITESYSPTIYPAHGPGDQWNLTTRYGYDAVGRRVWVTDTLGHVAYTGYDAAGRVVTAVANYVDGAFDPAHPDEDVATTYGYDAAGQRTWVTDTLGYVTRTWYDPVGRVISTTANYTTAGGQNYLDQYNVVTWYGYDAVGNQTHVTDTLGYVTLTEYDPLNRPVTVTANYTATAGPDANLQTIYEYDAVGNVVAVADPAGRVTRAEYDVLNRPVTVTVNSVQGGGAPDENQTSLSVYDELGRVEAQVQLSGTERITTTAYAYDALGQQTAITDAEGNATYLAYDALGQQTQVTDAEGNATQNEYDAAGRLSAVTGALPGTTRYVYDALGRRTAVVDPLTHTVYYGYDGLGRTVAVTDAAGTAHLVYDALGRQTAITDAAGVATYSAYDALRRLVETRDALGNRTQYAYDALGNRVVVTETVLEPVEELAALGLELDPPLALAGAESERRAPGLAAFAPDTLWMAPRFVTPTVTGFEAVPLTGDAPLTVTLTAKTAGEVTSYLWDLGDGTTSTEASPVHVYNEPGVYTVSLTVAGPEGGDTFTQESCITVTEATLTPPLLVDFEASPLNGHAPLSVAFGAVVTGEVTGYSWSFGDGATSSEANPTHVYEKSGIYTVRLDVSAPGGTRSSTRPDYITVVDAPLSASEVITTALPVSSTIEPGEPAEPVNRHDWLAREEQEKGRYYVVWQDQTPLPELAGAYQAANPAQGFQVYFAPDGLSVLSGTAIEHTWTWRMQLTGYGYEGDIRPIDRAELAASGNAVEYRRGSASGHPAQGPKEWYVNEKRGLEQGFTLDSPPLPSGPGPLVLELLIDTDLTTNLAVEPSGAQDGMAFEFTTTDEDRVLRYSGLRAYDATGRRLRAYMDVIPASEEKLNSVPVEAEPSAPIGESFVAGREALSGRIRMPLSAKGIRLVVEDEDAVYPITIDPLLEGGGPYIYNKVVFSNDLEATVSRWDITEVEAFVPSDVVSGPVVVETERGLSNESSFTVGSSSVPSESGEGNPGRPR